MSFVPENVVEMYDGNQIGVPENVTQNLAHIEVTGTATRAYAVGDYMVFGGLLRKVTQAIAQGGTITVGTNVESTKVSTELQGISSDLSELLRGYVSVNAIATDTYGGVLKKLYDAIDTSKLTANSYFITANGYIFRMQNLSTINFSISSAGSSGAEGERTQLNNTLSNCIWFRGAGATLTQIQSTTISSSLVGEWRLYY